MKYKVRRIWQGDSDLESELNLEAEGGWLVVSVVYMYESKGERYTTKTWGLYTVVFGKER